MDIGSVLNQFGIVSVLQQAGSGFASVVGTAFVVWLSFRLFVKAVKAGHRAVCGEMIRWEDGTVLYRRDYSSDGEWQRDVAAQDAR